MRDRKILEPLDPGGSNSLIWAKALWTKWWTKNTFVAAPLVFSGRATDLESDVATAAATPSSFG